MKHIDPGTGTVRQQMMVLLSESQMDVHDLSVALRIPEKDVADHLAHLSRSLAAARMRLKMEPCRCLSCGFEFRERRRFTKPGRCPACRKSHLTQPVFWVDPF